MSDEPGFRTETHSTYEPTPAEVSARRLAQIEERAREHLSDDAIMVPIVELTASARDVLALVEIARAAQEWQVCWRQFHEAGLGYLGDDWAEKAQAAEANLGAALARLGASQ